MFKTRARRAQGRETQALRVWTTYNRAKTLRTSMASTNTSMKRLLVHRFQIDWKLVFNLSVGFVEGGKAENLEKNPRGIRVSSTDFAVCATVPHKSTGWE